LLSFYLSLSLNLNLNPSLYFFLSVLSQSDSLSLSLSLSLSVCLSLSVSFSHTQRDIIKKGFYWINLFCFPFSRVDAAELMPRSNSTTAARADAAAGSSDQQEGNLATGTAVGIQAGQG